MTMTIREQYEFHYHLARKMGAVVPDKPNSPDSTAKLQAWRSLNNRALTFDEQSWRDQRAKWYAWWNRVRSNQIKDIKARYRSYLNVIDPLPYNPPVVVQFRVSKDDPTDVYALFPDLPGTYENPKTCTCYQRIGQHGSADYEYCIRKSRPIDAPDLYRELTEQIGYNLRVVRRYNASAAYDNRHAEIARIERLDSERAWQFMGRKHG